VAWPTVGTALYQERLELLALEDEVGARRSTGSGWVGHQVPPEPATTCSEAMANAIGGVFVAILFGALALAPERFARWSIRWQSRTWGFRFGDKTIRGTAVMVRVIGIVGAAVGLGLIITAK
jgi:hypothetical protein